MQVRGKAVSYDKATINAYYQVPDIAGDDEFIEYIRDKIDLEEVTKAYVDRGLIGSPRSTRRSVSQIRSFVDTAKLGITSFAPS